MEPAAALERIAYLLDRAREKPYRVNAYLRAAQVVKALAPDELRERVAAGTLEELDGIGPKTASVITEVATSGSTAFLEKLEVDTALTVGQGNELVVQLKGDLHVHSLWSDGGAEIDVMARAARDLGHEYFALTDHSPRLTIANGLSRERLLKQLDIVAGLNRELAPFRILTGIEVDILEDGKLDQDDDILERLDVVVASVHSKLRMEREQMTRRMIVAIADPHTDILGHCTGRYVTGRGRPQSQFDAELVFHACEQFDTAVEINSRPERLDPPNDLLKIAVEMGCEFAISTDAHAPGQLEWQPYGADKAIETGVTIDRVINSRSAEELIAWTRRRR
ncbi:MAG TPA: PHP domain-containing protein [Candidatus Limnocylindrales bacterium]|nr:PHP domain-containing protein [Candidatus Limnocylindrales bacterium]